MSTNTRSEGGAGPSPHLSVEEMNDLVDGLLAPEGERRARAHLAGCPQCREEVEALDDAVSAMGELPDEADVPEGVWDRIADRMASREGASTAHDGARGDGVLPFPGRPRAAAAHGPGGPPPRRRTFGTRHLAIAAALAAVLSGGAVWVALGPGAGAGGTVAGTPERTAPAVTSPARAASTGGQVAYDLAVQELELLVREGGDVLAPETREALEKSLATIDEALADVRQALEEDPSSELLMSLLVNHQTARIRLLRQAAARIQASI